MFRRFASLLLPFLLAVTLTAQDDEPKLDFAAGIASRTVTDGIAWTRGAAVGSAAVTLGGWHGCAETAQPLTARNLGGFALSGGYDWKLSDPRLSLGIEAEQRWVQSAPAGFENTLTSAGLSIGRETPVGRLTAHYIREFQRRTDRWTVSWAREVPLTRFGTYLQLSAWAGWASAHDLQPSLAGPARRDGYSDAGVRLTLPYRIPTLEHASLLLGVEAGEIRGQSRFWSPLQQSLSGYVAGRAGVTFDF